MLTISAAAFTKQFGLVWEPLVVGNEKVPLWKYEPPRTDKTGSDRPVIYRHVVEISGTIQTIYVGQGSSLNGPRKASLVYQYSSPGKSRKTRKKIRKFFEGRTDGWTELLTCAQIDMHSDPDRLALESLLIGLYYFESRNSPEFRKQQLVYLNGAKG